MKNGRWMTSCLLLCVFCLPPVDGISGRVHAQGEKQPPKSDPRDDKELHGGLSFNQWIDRVQQGKLEDREDALQVMRNLGLRHNRERTIAVFTAALADKEITIRSLSAVGLKKAGRPVPEETVIALLKSIETELDRVEKGGRRTDPGLGVVIRSWNALEVLAEKPQFAALQKLAEDDRMPNLAQRFARQAVKTVERRITGE